MTWFKIDDAFWAHPKTMSLTAEAIALWVRAGSWSCQQLTDGIVPTRSLVLFGASQEVVDELVDAGFWYVIDEGYEFHDWDEYQETSEVVKARRERARERMRVVRANRERTEAERAREQSAKFAGSSLNPDPTRPDPTVPSNEGTSKRPARRGSPLPQGWLPSAATYEWAAKERPDLNIDKQVEAFCDYWPAQSGAKGLKANWDLTFKTWIRNARGQSSGYQPKPSQSDKFHDTLALGREVQAELDALGGFELKGIA